MDPRFAASDGIALQPERLPRSATVGLRGRRLPADTDDLAMWSALLGVERRSEMTSLAALARVRQVAGGQTVFSRHGPATQLVALRAGEVALGLRTVDGTFRTERIVRGPAWLDLGSAWLERPHAVDAQALGPATVLELPCAALAVQLDEHPGLAIRLIRGLSHEVQALSANTHELMHKDAPARLAQWLHQRLEPLPGEPLAERAVVRLRERKRDVAAQLAITPETLSRLMRSFIRQGVIEVAGYTVRVLDTAALARLAAA